MCERYIVASRTPPTGDLAHNPGMCPDWELNWRPFGSQASTQSTEPHPPGLYLILEENVKMVSKMIIHALYVKCNNSVF